MLHLHARLSLALLAPLALAACDAGDTPFVDEGDVVTPRCEPNCGGGGSTNTSYAGEWPLANFSTQFGVHATNWTNADVTTAVLDSAYFYHDAVWRQATKVWVTSEGELRMSYQSCSSCTVLTGQGAGLEEARMYFKFYRNNVHLASYWIEVRDYVAETIHNKTAHTYELSTNAPKLTGHYGDQEYALCNPNSGGEVSNMAVFIPGMRLTPLTLSIEAATQSAIIACKTGADGKLVLGYGYHQTDLGVAKKWTAGLKMTTADICGDGNTHTMPGRLISMQDSAQIKTWDGSLTVREGDYDHTGMVCRGEALRGPSGYLLEDLEQAIPCLANKPLCSASVTAPAAGSMTFGVKVEGP